MQHSAATVTHFTRTEVSPLPCPGKASFAHHYGAVQWKQFLISGAEPSYLPPLIQEKDTELQTVSIPDILFPAPKLPFPFLKKVKATVLKRSKVLAFQHHRNLPQGNSQKATMKHLLQPLKETTLTSAGAMADKSKQGPAQNTCLLVTA